MANYFNQLSLRDQLNQLAQCRFMDASEFEDGIAALAGKKIVIVGCGAQGLNQGLNMRDSRNGKYMGAFQLKMLVFPSWCRYWYRVYSIMFKEKL